MNKFMVGLQGDNVVTLVPLPQKFSKDDALTLAAWLVAIADPIGDKFKAKFDAACDS